jgi:hypothetical protein
MTSHLTHGGGGGDREKVLSKQVGAAFSLVVFVSFFVFFRCYHPSEVADDNSVTEGEGGCVEQTGKSSVRQQLTQCHVTHTKYHIIKLYLTLRIRNTISLIIHRLPTSLLPTVVCGNN